MTALSSIFTPDSNIYKLGKLLIYFGDVRSTLFTSTEQSFFIKGLREQSWAFSGASMMLLVPFSFYYWTMNWLFPENRPHSSSLQVRKKRFDSCTGSFLSKCEFVLPLKINFLIFQLKKISLICKIKTTPQVFIYNLFSASFENSLTIAP